MKYFVIFGLLIFLGMMLYVDLLKLIIQKDYQEGMKAIPLILLANLFFVIYFTLSLEDSAIIFLKDDEYMKPFSSISNKNRFGST